LKIARGVLGEDDCLLREILFNPRTKNQVERICDEMKDLVSIIDRKDEDALNHYLTRSRENIK
jgi:prephenate dehydrogenase